MPTETAQGLAWITGGGSGIGRALALDLAAQGWQVVISGRRLDVLTAVAADNVQIIPKVLDVTDAEATGHFIDDLLHSMGVPNLVVLNAGDYKPMPAEDFDLALIRQLNAVNYLGVMNGLAACLPAMRQRGSGQILLMASVAGYRGLPDAAPYGATKAALINFAESLYPILKREGVLLRIVNPGFVKTPLTAQNRFAMPALLEPEDAARRIVAQLDQAHFEIAFPRRFVFFLKLLRCLPYRLYFWLITKVTRK
jgi:NADP-dependent 3-hydroxy acid dehydrogenase YdfG